MNCYAKLRAQRARLLIGGLLMMIGILLVPVQAQEVPRPTDAPAVVAPVTTSPETAPVASVPLMYGVMGVLALLLVGAMVYGSYLTRFLAKLVPPETASAIYASGVRFGFQVALNHAAQTPSTLDDEFFEAMAQMRGLTVIKRADGSYEVKQAAAASTPKMPV